MPLLEQKKDIEVIINRIKKKEIVPYFPSMDVPVDDEVIKDAIGLQCLNCLTKKEGYTEFTKNPAIVSCEKNGKSVTFYFHEECLDWLSKDYWYKFLYYFDRMINLVVRP